MPHTFIVILYNDFQFNFCIFSALESNRSTPHWNISFIDTIILTLFQMHYGFFSYTVICNAQLQTNLWVIFILLGFRSPHCSFIFEVTNINQLIKLKSARTGYFRNHVETQFNGIICSTVIRDSCIRERRLLFRGDFLVSCQPKWFDRRTVVTLSAMTIDGVGRQSLHGQPASPFRRLSRKWFTSWRQTGVSRRRLRPDGPCPRWHAPVVEFWKFLLGIIDSSVWVFKNLYSAPYRELLTPCRDCVWSQHRPILALHANSVVKIS